MTTKCNLCQDNIIENQANNKTFYYCRTCKDERTNWGYEIAKPEAKKETKEPVRQVYSKDDLYGQYGGGHNQPDPYNTWANVSVDYPPVYLTQKEVDEMFHDMFQGAD